MRRRVGYQWRQGDGVVDAESGVCSFGVEEEFFVVDPDSRRVVAAAPKVRAVRPELVAKELTRYQVEIATRPCDTLAELRADLYRRRAGVVRAAARVGYAVLPSGTAPLGGAGLPVTDDDRYDAMEREYRDLLGRSGVCGCHVHVALPDRWTALRVSNHLRPWLPVLAAISSNSPYRSGHDTGYASWRTIAWSSWPVAGPAPFWRSDEHYEALVDGLIQSGVILDTGMLYWYARPSARFPTLELRACDVLPTVDGTLLVAALARALVGTALADLAGDVAAVDVPTEMLRAAHWRAARDGLAGDGVDVLSGRPKPAAELVRALVSRVRPALDRAGDTAVVLELLARLDADGGPAQRQRLLHARRGDLRDVVDALVTGVTG